MAKVTKAEEERRRLELEAKVKASQPAPVKGRRGFAAMDPETQKRIASMGGKKAHLLGKAHRLTTETAMLAGRKGGQKVSQDRDHMREIGSRGGRAKKGGAK